MTTAKYEITNELPEGVDQQRLDELVAEAEYGYDVDKIIRRRGRPTLGKSASSVESVRFSPETKRDLIVRASRDGISVSETIRRAVDAYLHTG